MAGRVVRVKAGCASMVVECEGPPQRRSESSNGESGGHRPHFLLPFQVHPARRMQPGDTPPVRAPPVFPA